MNRTITSFRNGVFALHTIRFGMVAEIMIMKLYNLNPSGVKEYDLYDSKNKKRIEVKFSRASRKHSNTITVENVLEQCKRSSSLENQFIKSDEIDGSSFDSNIQQVKPKNFDYLYYGLFFMDCVKVYKIPSSKICGIRGYSDKQHAGNIGEGQFHLNEGTIKHHDKYLKKTLTYEELYNLLL